MAGVKDGEKVWPRLSESELAGWLERWRRAALRIRTGQLVLRIQEGLPYELVATQQVDVASGEGKPDLARPGLERYLDRIKASFREIRFGELSVEIEEGALGPLVIVSRERR